MGATQDSLPIDLGSLFKFFEYDMDMSMDMIVDEYGCECEYEYEYEYSMSLYWCLEPSMMGRHDWEGIKRKIEGQEVGFGRREGRERARGRKDRRCHVKTKFS